MSQVAVAASPRIRFYYGWIIVGVCMVVNGLSGNIGTFFGLFVVPIQDDLGWTRTSVVFAVTVAALVGAGVQPVIGPLLDRYGGRGLTVVAGLIGGTAVVTAAWIQQPWQLYIAYGLYGAAANGVGMQVTNVVVAKWFVTKRGRALGFASVGLSGANLIMVPLLQALITGFGWRLAIAVLGMIVAVGLMVPAGLFMRRQPEDMGLRPDGLPPVEPKPTAVTAAAQSSRTVVVEDSWTLPQALRTKAFYLLLVAWMFASLPVQAAFIHTIPYLRGDKGFDPALAATAWTVWFFCGSISKLAWGFISERLPARVSVAACLFGEAAGIAMLLNVGGSIPLLFLWSFIGGFGHGPFAQLQTLIFANYYGRRFLGSIRGTVQPFIVISGAVGPLLAAYLFQQNGNYQVAWTLFVVMLVIAATLALVALPPRRSASTQHVEMS